jgi:hypothetical protein
LGENSSALEPGFLNRRIGEKNVIAKGNPWELKRKPTDGALHFDTNANMLYAGESDERGARWVCLGHCVPVDPPRWNEPIPKVKGYPYPQGPRLQGVE